MTDPSTDPIPQLAPAPDNNGGSSFSTSVPPSLLPAPPAPNPMKKWFFGPQGLRAGWGFVLYVALVFLMRTLAHTLFHRMMARLVGTLWQQMASLAIVLLCVALPAVALAFVEKRSFGCYGLPARAAFGKRFLLGVVWGFAALSLLLGMLRAAHVFYFGAPGLHGIRVLKFALFWAVFFILVGLFEEFTFRGYALFTLARGFAFWPAALILSVLFGWVHLGNKGENWLGAAAAGLIGLFFCFTLRRTGNLWFAVGMHASWDWAESYFYGVADSGQVSAGHLFNSSSQGPAWLSGGSVGPEGSVLVFLVIALLFVVFHFLFPPQNATAAPTGNNS